MNRVSYTFTIEHVQHNKKNDNFILRNSIVHESNIKTYHHRASA